MKKFCVLASFSGDGGVEKNLIRLIRGFLKKGAEFELLTIKERGTFLKELPVEVRKKRLPFKQALLNIPFLVSYLKKNRPYAIFSVKDRANRIAIISKLISKTPVKVIIRLGTNLSASLMHKNFITRWFRFLPSKLFYPLCDEIIAVSKGVAQDVATYSGIPLNKIKVIPNPVVDDTLIKKAHEKIKDEWFLNKKYPLIVGIGRLTYQKDFVTGIKAIKRLKDMGINVRYAIIGDGSQREKLQDIIKQLSLEDRVKLMGFKKNPYKYLSRADLFLLSSRWEGSPNALIEAMALGIPVVSTNCPSGPDEILSNDLSPLVKVGNHIEMAEAIAKVLKNPPSKEKLIKTVGEFDFNKSVEKYLKTILD